MDWVKQRYERRKKRSLFSKNQHVSRKRMIACEYPEVQEQRPYRIPSAHSGVLTKHRVRQPIIYARETSISSPEQKTVAKVPEGVKESKAPPVLNSDWLEIHRPKSIVALIGRKKQIDLLSDWLREFKNNENPKYPIALLHGRPGTGKTTLARLILSSFNYRVVEVNASDTRSYEEIMQCLDRVCLRKGITGKSALLLDEIDGAFEASSGKSSIKAIIDFLTAHKKDKNKSPIICTCNITHKHNIKALFTLSCVIPFWKFYDSDLRLLCARVARNHQLRFTDAQITSVIQQSDGDARQIVNSLHLQHFRRCLNLAKKDDGSNIFEVVQCIFNNRKLDVSSDLFQDCGFYGIGLLFENYAQVIHGYPENNDTKEKSNRQNKSLDVMACFADACSEFDLMNVFSLSNPSSKATHSVDFIVSSAYVFAGQAPITRNYKLVKCEKDFFQKSCSENIYSEFEGEWSRKPDPWDVFSVD